MEKCFVTSNYVKGLLEKSHELEQLMTEESLSLNFRLKAYYLMGYIEALEVINNGKNNR